MQKIYKLLYSTFFSGKGLHAGQEAVWASSGGQPAHSKGTEQSSLDFAIWTK